MSPAARRRHAGRNTEILMQASKVISAAVAHSLALADETVSAPGLRVMVMLDAAGTLNLSAVADGLGVNASTASRACDRLVVDGLVDRREQAEDRRQVALSLTERGAEFLYRVMQRVVDAMGVDERAALLEGLAGFVAAATAISDGAGSVHGQAEIIRWLV